MISSNVRCQDDYETDDEAVESVESVDPVEEAPAPAPAPLPVEEAVQNDVAEESPEESEAKSEEELEEDHLQKIGLTRDNLGREDPDELTYGFFAAWAVILYLIAGSCAGVFIFGIIGHLGCKLLGKKRSHQPLPTSEA